MNSLKKKFGTAIKIDLLLQNNDNSRKLYKANIDQIDNHVPEKYSPAALEALLGPSEVKKHDVFHDKARHEKDLLFGVHFQRFLEREEAGVQCRPGKNLGKPEERSGSR